MGAISYSSQNNLKVFPASIHKDVCVDKDGTWEVKERLKDYFGDKPIWVNDKFLPFLDHEAKYQIYKGGSGSSKSTFIATNLLLKVMKQPFCRVLYVRKMFSDIRVSTFQLFKDLITRYGWDNEFKIMESTLRIIHIPTGNFLVAFGLDDVEKLKSIQDITDCWIEEAITKSQKVTFEEFLELDRRIRTSRAPNHIYLSFNPVDTDNFVYKYFVETPMYPEYDEVEAPRNSFILHTSSYLDNYFANPDESAKMDALKLVDEEEWNVYACGHWGNPKTGSEFINAFKYGVHVVDYEPQKKHFEYGADINVLPYMAGVVGQTWYDHAKNQLVIHIFDEVTCTPPDNTIQASIKELTRICKKYGVKELNWICDASARRRVPGYGDDKTPIAYYEMKKHIKRLQKDDGDKNPIMRKNPGIETTRDIINNILKGLHPNGIDKCAYRIEIHSRCKKLIYELKNLQIGPDGFDKERTTDSKTGQTYEKMGHHYQAFSYLIYYICTNYFRFKRIRTL